MTDLLVSLLARAMGEALERVMSTPEGEEAFCRHIERLAAEQDGIETDNGDDLR